MSESNNPEKEDVVAGAPKIGPGERLQAARIEQDLTIEDIANRMHLSTAILESIEDNNFDEITAPIFVKGYIRAYARIVSLPEEELIQQYSEFYSNEDPPIASTSNTVPEISSDDARIKWTTYLVIIVLIALLALWWWNKSQDRPDTVSLDANEPTSVEQIEESDTGSAASEVVVSIAADSERVEPTINVDEAELESEESVSQSVNELAQPEEEPDTVAAVDEVVIEPDVDEVDDNLSENTESTDNVTDVSLTNDELDVEPEITKTEEVDPDRILRQAPNGDDHLVLKVNADTWADIKDGNNHRLVYDLLRAGKSMELVGKAPFRLFFGNGHGVELNFNQKTIDVSPNIRDDNTARMTVGN